MMCLAPLLKDFAMGLNLTFAKCQIFAKEEKEAILIISSSFLATPKIQYTESVLKRTFANLTILSKFLIDLELF